MSIDGTAYLRALEEVLERRDDFWKCNEAFAVLRRWKNDEMLTRETRLYARDLLSRFGDPSIWTPCTLETAETRKSG